MLHSVAHSGYYLRKQYEWFYVGKIKRRSIGLKRKIRNGRTIIAGVNPRFRIHDQANALVGCELLAIRDAAGILHNVREIDPWATHALIAYRMRNDAKVTLELFDEVRLRRFSVEWPRR